MLKWFISLFQPKKPVRQPRPAQLKSNTESARKSKFGELEWQESVWEKSMTRETWLKEK